MQSQSLFTSRRTWLIVISVIVVGALAFAVYRRRGSPPSPPENRKITIAQAGDFFLYAPLYIAKDAGIFANKGLDVDLISTGGDDKTWAAIISGSASFGVADPTFVAISDKRGQPGRVIASVVNGVPFWGITFKPNITTTTDAKQLAKYRVATFPAPSTAFTLQKDMFQRAGVQGNIREGAFGTLMAMLKSDQADIALELEPNVSQAVAEGAHVIYAMSDVYGDFAITGLTASPELLARDPKLAEDVVCALQQALDFARKQPDATLGILAKRFPEIKPQVAQAALTRAINSGIIPRETTIGQTAWDKAIDVRVKVGDLSAPKTMDAYVDNTFAKHAVTSCRSN